MPSESMKQISSCWLGSLFWITAGKVESNDYSSLNHEWMKEIGFEVFFKNKIYAMKNVSCDIKALICDIKNVIKPVI